MRPLPGSPQERYENDVEYKQMVDVMTNFIVKLRFTPGEMRDMAVLASIRYEMFYLQNFRAVPFQVNEALETLKQFRTKPEPAKETPE